MMVTAKLLYCDSSSRSVVTTAVNSVYFYKAMGQGWGFPFSSTPLDHTPHKLKTFSPQCLPKLFHPSVKKWVLLSQGGRDYGGVA